MTIEDSSDLGIAFGSAGETSVLICVAINRSWGRSTRKWLSCSSRALAGDWPEGNLWRITSKIFAFMAYEYLRMRVSGLRSFQAALAFKPGEVFWWYTRHGHAVSRMRVRCGISHANRRNASNGSSVSEKHLRVR